MQRRVQRRVQRRGGRRAWHPIASNASSARGESTDRNSEGQNQTAPAAAGVGSRARVPRAIPGLKINTIVPVETSRGCQQHASRQEEDLSILIRSPYPPTPARSERIRALRGAIEPLRNLLRAFRDRSTWLQPASRTVRLTLRLDEASLLNSDLRHHLVDMWLLVERMRIQRE